MTDLGDLAAGLVAELGDEGYVDDLDDEYAIEVIVRWFRRVQRVRLTRPVSAMSLSGLVEDALHADHWVDLSRGNLLEVKIYLAEVLRDLAALAEQEGVQIDRLLDRVLEDLNLEPGDTSPRPDFGGLWDVVERLGEQP